MALAPVWPQVLIATVLCIVLKSIGITLGVWLFGVSASVSAAVGIGLAQGGEFSIVVLQSAHEAAILSDAWLNAATAVVVLTLILTPSMLSAGRLTATKIRGWPSAPWVHSGRDGLDEIQHESDRVRVVIGGFGPVGRAVAEELEKQSIPYSIIEMNQATVQTQTRLGKRIIFGDIANTDVLESAGLITADALVLTIPDEHAAMLACTVARTLTSDLFIAVRTGLSARANIARGLGADLVVTDELAAAHEMQRAVLERLKDQDITKTTPDSSA